MKGLIILILTIPVFVFCSKVDYYNLANNNNNNNSDDEQQVEIGCPDVAYPDWETSSYVLPYSIGKSYKIDLSNCSGSYHSQGEPDQFALDFNMPIGTLITASREGIVVFVEEGGSDGGFPNNLIVIKHVDNTFAEYMHLTNNGAIVEVGDEVIKGTEIGYSGSTGLAGYPHLHLVVALDDPSYPYTSTPITFKNTRANPNSLVSGEIYTADSY